MNLEMLQGKLFAITTGKPPSYVLSRYRIRDSSNRKIGARMKVFEEFISLFDDSQTE